MLLGDVKVKVKVVTAFATVNIGIICGSLLSLPGNSVHRSSPRPFEDASLEILPLIVGSSTAHNL